MESLTFELDFNFLYNFVLPDALFTNKSAAEQLYYSTVKRTYPTVVMVMNAHQNPSNMPLKNDIGNWSAFSLRSYRFKFRGVTKVPILLCRASLFEKKSIIKTKTIQ